MAANKTVCPISRDEFRAGAKPITVTIDGKQYIAAPKEFSTGGIGWNISDKMEVEIAGKPVKLQIGLNLSCVGAKDLPK